MMTEAMTPHDLVVGLVAGGVALAFGLIPGLFESLTEGVRNFGDSLSLGVPVPRRRLPETESRQRPLGLAGFGALIVVFTVLAYVWN